MGQDGCYVGWLATQLRKSSPCTCWRGKARRKSRYTGLWGDGSRSWQESRQQALPGCCTSVKHFQAGLRSCQNAVQKKKGQTRLGEDRLKCWRKYFSTGVLKREGDLGTGGGEESLQQPIYITQDMGCGPGCSECPGFQSTGPSIRETLPTSVPRLLTAETFREGPQVGRRGWEVILTLGCR